MVRIVVISCIAARVAHAEPPVFVSLDRATGTSNAGAHLALMLFEDQDTDGGGPTLEQPRLQLYGEYAATPHVGVLVSASVIWFRSEPESELGIGALHVGGYGRLVRGDLELVGRASVVFPTSTFVPRDSYYEDVAIRGTLLPWLGERASDAGAFWLHAGTSARFRRARLIAQVDALADVPLSGGVYRDDMSRGAPVRVHVGAGIAYASAPWRFGIEVLASGYPWAEQLYGDLEADELTFYGLTMFAARGFDGGHEGIVWFSNALNEYLRSRWHAVGLGYQARL